MGNTISCKRPDGQSVSGYLVEPAQGENAPGVVVIQEWWGLNEQIKGVAEKLAAAGYRALVPDLYRGKVALEANEAEHLMTNLDFGDAAGQEPGAVGDLPGTRLLRRDGLAAGDGQQHERTQEQHGDQQQAVVEQRGQAPAESRRHGW